MNDQEFEDLSMKVLLEEASDEELNRFRSTYLRDKKWAQEYEALKAGSESLQDAALIGGCIEEAKSGKVENQDENLEALFDKIGLNSETEESAGKIIQFVKLSVLPLAACVVLAFTIKLAFFGDKSAEPDPSYAAEEPALNAGNGTGVSSSGTDGNQNSMVLVSGSTDIPEISVSVDDIRFSVRKDPENSYRISLNGEGVYESWLVQELELPASLKEILGEHFDKLQVDQPYELRMSGAKGGAFESLKFKLNDEESAVILP